MTVGLFYKYLPLKLSLLEIKFKAWAFQYMACDQSLNGKGKLRKGIHEIRLCKEIYSKEIKGEPFTDIQSAGGKPTLLVSYFSGCAVPNVGLGNCGCFMFAL